jgi:hypothetical protein
MINAGFALSSFRFYSTRCKVKGADNNPRRNRNRNRNFNKDPNNGKLFIDPWARPITKAHYPLIENI